MKVLRYWNSKGEEINFAWANGGFQEDCLEEVETGVRREEFIGSLRQQGPCLLRVSTRKGRET